MVNANRAEAEAKRKGFELSQILTEDSFLKIASKMSFSNHEEMYASVGYGAVSVNQILVKLIDYYRKHQPKQDTETFYRAKQGNPSGVIVKGTSGILVRFAGCCHPVPGDDITGFISRGHGVTVHRSDCVNIRHADPDRIIEVSWADRDKNSSYNAGIKVIGESQTEILSAVLGVVAQMKLSIVSTNGRIDPKNKTAVVDFSIMLNGREELDGLINKLRQVNKIYDVFRTNS